MAEFPALPLFTDAFIGDTTHLTAAQTGAYLMLLMIAWRTPDCSLPDDDQILARYARMDIRAWKCNRITILAFFQKHSDGRLRQGRLTDERNYVEGRSNKNSQAAKARWLKHKNTADANAMPEACQVDAPTPTPTVKEEAKEASSKKPHKMPFDVLPFEWKVWVINEKGWDDSIIDDTWSIFREYWQTGKGRNTKREDWTATWHNWCRKENYPSKTNGGTHAAKQSKIDIAAEAIKRGRALYEQRSEG
jgi:uncharacterized protein YdaU (DUF1376 family)